MAKWRVHPDEEPSRQAQALAEQVERDGGTVLAIYQEPVGDHWQIFALLPMDKVEPTPYQRDLSPTHAKKLQDVVKKIDRFVDPVVVMSPRPGVYWTPNGNHRRVVLGKLKAKVIPAILVPEAEVAFQILALNTEKAHNLKEKSLEVIRMYRGLVDEFLKGHFPKTLKEREERAALVREADEALVGAVARIKKRGISHPYVKNFVLARTTPLTRQRKTLPGFEQTFRKLVDNIEAFDVSKVRYEDIQRSAIMAVPAG